MQTVTLDFETFWTTDFSLSKISFMEYIKSPEFEVLSVAIKIGNADTNVYFGADVGPAIKAIDWSDTAAIAHNGNEFDHPLLVWKYDVHPKLFVDTLCMARPYHQSDVGGSLKKLSERYLLPAKDSTILTTTKGKRLKDFTREELEEMSRYNKQDTDNTYALFLLMRAKPVGKLEDLRDITKATVSLKKELALSDMTARAIIYPQFVADTCLLESTLAQAKLEKEAMLNALCSDLMVATADELKTELGSSKKFAALLLERGVELPTKISKKTGKVAYAMAKDDEGFLALQEHPDPIVQALVAARLGVKSTLLETRLARMAASADAMGGWMPVPLAYHSATTGRWGGRVWNPQNLPRIPRNKQGDIVPKLTNALRMSLCAPEGHMVVVSDLSGIELRINHYLWEVASTQFLYENDPTADLYKEFAAALYGIDKSEVTKEQRQLAKVAQLGLGFGAGWNTFKRVAKSMGGVILDDTEAERVTVAWRSKYRDIVDGWRACNRAVECMFNGSKFRPDPRGLCETFGGGIRLPSGRCLYYPNMTFGQSEKDVRPGHSYGEGKNKGKLYGGLMDENLVQAIARDVIAEQALHIKTVTGYSPALMVHDELVYVVPEHKAQAHLDTINKIMRTPPTWLPDIVLWSEGDIAVNYGEAK